LYITEKDPVQNFTYKKKNKNENYLQIFEHILILKQ